MFEIMFEIILVIIVLIVIYVSFVDKRKTINVCGKAAITYEADIASFTVNITETAHTTEEALNNVNCKMAKVARVLEEFKVDKIETGTLKFEPTKEYHDDDYTIVQEARHVINVKIKDLEKLPKVIDALSKITSIRVDSINTDKEDKTELYDLAKKAAFEQAKQKAELYASLSGLKLGKAIKIYEQEDEAFYKMETSGRDCLMQKCSIDSYSTSYYENECTVSAEINVNFLAK